MDICCVVTGVLDENCYVIKKNGTCLIVDPGDDYLKIKKEIGDNKIIGILITHSHFDHVGALRHFLGRRGLKIFKRSISSEGIHEVGDFKFEVIYTPGHAKDLVSFYFPDEKVMFDGDFVFKESIGRCDLPGGSVEEMKKSLQKLLKYDSDIVLYPGHGDKTTIGYEQKNNIYIKEF